MMKDRDDILTEHFPEIKHGIMSSISLVILIHHSMHTKSNERQLELMGKHENK